MTMNLRIDDTFVQDGGWYAAARRYEDFLRRHQGRKLLLLELGVGGNTPVIIKYPFWKMAAQSHKTTYVCVNQGETYVPGAIQNRSICVRGDIGAVLSALLRSGPA